MIKAIYGGKGTGKTKKMIEHANSLADSNYGCIAFIDFGKELIYNLKHGIRLIDITDFPIDCEDGFLGFICGMVAQNYDLKWIFIDRITDIINENVENLESFFSRLKSISGKYNIDFNISVPVSQENMPEFLFEFI